MQELVCPTQFFECVFEESLVLDSLARTQGCQPVQSDIDADRGLLFLWQGVWHLKLDTHEPPVCCFGDACACHLALKAQVLCHIHQIAARCPWLQSRGGKPRCPQAVPSCLSSIS